MSSSPAAEALAHRLLAEAVPLASDAAARGTRDERGDERHDDPVAVATRVFAGVAETLARWFGPHGYHALLTRALAHARTAHPALATVRVRAPLTPLLDGLPEAAAAHSASAVTAAVAAVLAGIVDLLGRVIGDDMARHLLEPPMDRATSSSPTPSTAPHAADTDGAMIVRDAEGAR